VRHKRLKLDIPFFNPEFRPWTRAEDKLLGTMPDAEVARRIKAKRRGRSQNGVTACKFPIASRASCLDAENKLPC